MCKDFLYFAENLLQWGFVCYLTEYQCVKACFRAVLGYAIATFSLSQKSRVKLVSTMPWREPTNETRAESMRAWIMPCKEKEDKVKRSDEIQQKIEAKEVFKWRKYHSKTSSSCVFYSAGCKSAYSVLHEKQGQAFLTPGNSLCPTMRALGYSARSSFSSDRRDAFCISVRVSAGWPFSSSPPS